MTTNEIPHWINGEARILPSDNHGSVTESDCDQCNRCLASMSTEGVSCARTIEETTA